ncbi:MAG: hypothetical protein AAGD88_04935 [Bacteroidota bacterium]
MKNLTILTLLLFIVSCSSSESDGNEQNLDNPTNNDNQSPTISLQNTLSGIVEELTNLVISVSDNSDDVQTVITVNGEEVFSTNQLNFTYSIDPFDFNDGPKTLNIKATDEAGNEIEEQLSFDTKKFLFSIPDYQGNLSTSERRIFVGLNLKNGELISYRELMSSEDGTFYAEDGFERQDIVATIYDFNENSREIISFTDIPAGTKIPDFDDVKMKFFQPLEEISNFNVAITYDLGFPLEPFTLESRTFSYDEKGGGSSGNVQNLNCLYNPSSPPTDLFIYFHENSLDPTNYRYLSQPITDLSDKAYNLSEFSEDWSNSQISIPSGISSYSILMNGFTDEQAYQNNEFREFYRIFRRNQIPTEPVNIPTIPQFPIIQQRLSIDLAPGVFGLAWIKGTGTFTIPDRTVNLSEVSAEVIGEFNSYRVSLGIRREPLDFSSPGILWSYYGDYQPFIEYPYKTLQIPGEVTNLFEVQGYDLSQFEQSGSEEILLTLYDYELDAPYNERIFYEYKGNEKGNRIEMSYID